MKIRRLSTLAVGAAVLTGSLLTMGAVVPADAATPSAPIRSFAPTLGLAPAALSPLAGVPIGPDPLAALASSALDEWYIFATTGLGEHLARFIAIRDAIAVEAAARIEVDPLRLQKAWADADQRHQIVLMAAMTQLGTPYHTRMNEPGRGFDCSGFTSFAWAATDIVLPTQSKRQINMVTPLFHEQAQPGDLIYYPGHVSLYLGIDFAILHAPDYGDVVSFSHLRSGRQRSARFGGPLG